MITILAVINIAILCFHYASGIPPAVGWEVSAFVAWFWVALLGRL